MNRTGRTALLLLLVASLLGNAVLFRRSRATQSIRQQEIAYTKAAAARTYYIVPEYGMRFLKDSDPATQPIPGYNLELCGTSWEPTSRGRPLSYVTFGSQHNLHTDISLFRAPPLAAPDILPAPTPQAYAVYSVLRQLRQQDSGWFGVHMDAITDVAVGYAVHGAGMVTVIAHPDRRDPNRILIRYTYGFFCGPTRGWMSFVDGGPQFQFPEIRPVFFQPDVPERE